MAREAGRSKLWPPELERLYRDEYAAMVRFAYLLCRSRETAEEAVQDAFLATRPHWASITTNPRAYVRRAVANSVYQRHRRQLSAARLHLLAPSALAPLSSSYEVAELLDRLTWPQRVAVVSRYWMDLDDKAIAQLLGCRPATVRSHVSRALAVLRRELEDL